MPRRHSRPKRERRAKTLGAGRRASPPTIAQAAARALTLLVRQVERSFIKINNGKTSESRVHKLRGALRKLEIMIGALACGFESRPAEKFLKLVKRARKTAGRVRDLDVAADVVRRVCSAGTADLQRAGAEVTAMLAPRRAAAFRSLASLSADQTVSLGARLSDLLKARAGRRARLPARCAAVVALAREATSMRDAIRAGLGTPELLHEVRLNILETLGQALGPNAEILADRARTLSDLLGQVNDLATLAELLAELEKKGSKKHREALQLVLAEVRAAHEKGHAAGVRRAAREAPALVRAIRSLIFPDMPGGDGDNENAAPGT
jgi:CHAD domain-containing protein